MRPAERGAGRSLAGDRGTAEYTQRTGILADGGDDRKQTAMLLALFAFATDLQRADVALLALAFVGGAS